MQKQRINPFSFFVLLVLTVTGLYGQARFEVVEQLDFLPMQYIFICKPKQ